ncbi:Bug family tripartite tricarboxylate transporter substrate binding protein [Variovorax sp. HJSM1_2]|uniref:Bug family tripartite tricarboxylate transporter substrate binding protein n=1 Tax=Variovorax sp. HJSM1_2 TaxID=3366263 RepID=UPI003BE961F7
MITSFSRRTCLRTVTGALALLALSSHAQSYPQRAIKLVVPFTPGGSADILARAVGQELAKSLGQPVVIENLPGAGGSVATERVLRAAADGYTLFMGHTGTLAVNPHLYPKLGLNPLRDFTPVALVAQVPNVLVVHPSVAAQTLADFITLAKAKPLAISYGSGGNGSAAHITMEYLKLQTGAPMQHVPYKGTAPSVNDLLAGQIQALFTGSPALVAHIKAGKMRALAVSSAKRVPLLPDVPTVAESGVQGTAGFEADQWYGLVAPANTPAPVVKLLNEHVNKALASTELSTRFSTEGAEPSPVSPAAFGVLIGNELKRWEKVVHSAKVTVD